MGSVGRLRTLVSTGWLAEKMGTGEGEVRVVHASWNNSGDYERAHIPGAVCFDGEYCRDQSSPYKNMLPNKNQFAQYVGNKLGINNESDVVVYDANETAPSILYAARVWWMFRVFGHDRVSLLNGGLKRWMDENRPVTSEPTQITPATFNAVYQKQLVLSYEEVMEKVVKRGEIQLVDNRPQQRYKGIGPDDGKPGHIPNAVNVPFSMIIDPNTKLIRDEKQLAEVFATARVDLSKPMGTSCGQGISASGGALAAFLLGKTDAPVYDGSWYEWARRAPDQYIVTDNE